MRLPDVRQRWRSLPQAVRDALVPLLLAAAAVTPGLTRSGIVLGDLPPQPVDAGALLLAGGQCAPLVVRRRWPVLCLAAVGSSFALYQASGYPPTSASLGFLVALYVVGGRMRAGWLPVALLTAAGYVGLTVVLHRRGSPERVVDFLTFALVLAAAWLVGSWSRYREGQEATRRRQEADRATADERARIARDLHDVVTHHVTAMVVQADAAGYLVGDPARLRSGLSAISGTGRRALAELRHLLDVLGDAEGGDSRHPVLGAVLPLVEQVRAAGQPVTLVERGARDDLPEAVEIAAYRVVQEALTNAVKHAAGHPVEVDIRRGDDSLELTVRTAGGRPHAPRPVEPGGGRGLAGSAERVTVLGGRFDAGPEPGGGFVVHAVFPSRRSEAGP